MDPILLLNIFQSVAERAPVVVVFAVRRENTPVRLLYERGQRAERAVSPILVDTVEVRVEREPERVFTVPESEVRLEFVVERLVFVVLRFHERVFILELVVLRVEFVVMRLPERVVRLVVLVFVVLVVPERAFCARASV